MVCHLHVSFFSNRRFARFHWMKRKRRKRGRERERDPGREKERSRTRDKRISKRDRELGKRAKERERERNRPRPPNACPTNLLSSFSWRYLIALTELVMNPDIANMHCNLTIFNQIDLRTDWLLPRLDLRSPPYMRASAAP